MRDGFSRIVTWLVESIQQSVVIIVKTLAVFVLALLAGILYVVRAALPYLLRGACVILFVFGFLQAMMAANALYAQIAEPLGGLFIAAALGVMLVALPVRALLMNENVWSAFALAGAVGFGCAFVCAQAQSNFVLQWIARGLPVSLAASGIVFIAATQKLRRIAVMHNAPNNSRSE